MSADAPFYTRTLLSLDEHSCHLYSDSPRAKQHNLMNTFSQNDRKYALKTIKGKNNKSG